MGKGKKRELNKIMHFINEELNEVSKIKNQSERIERTDVLFNFFKLSQNYNELEPELKDFFDRKAYKEKWGRDRDE